MQTVYQKATPEIIINGKMFVETPYLFLTKKLLYYCFYLILKGGLG